MSFELDGFAVTSAKDGREALASIEAEPPDIMILDILLPVMDGFEVLRRLALSRRFPVIAVSSNLELKQEATKLGAERFISKPFDPNKIVDTARALLKR